MFAFWGAEINFRGRAYETKTFFFLYFGSVDSVNARLSKAKRRGEAKYIFNVIQFNG